MSSLVEATSSTAEVFLESTSYANKIYNNQIVLTQQTTNTFTDDSFEECHVDDTSLPADEPSSCGGALFSFNRTSVKIVLDRCSFDECSASRDGGAIFLGAVDTVEVNHSTFLECRATEGNGGGAFVFMTSRRTQFSNTNFSDCRCKEQGAGLFVANVLGGDPVEVGSSSSSLADENTEINTTSFLCKHASDFSIVCAYNGEDPRFYLMFSCFFQSCTCAGFVKSSGGGCYVSNANISQQPVASNCYFCSCRADYAAGCYWSLGSGHMKKSDQSLFFTCFFETNSANQYSPDDATDVFIVDSYNVLQEYETIFSHCSTSWVFQSALLQKADFTIANISSYLTRFQNRIVGGSDAEDKEEVCGAIGQYPCETIYFAVKQRFPAFHVIIKTNASILTKETRPIVIDHSIIYISGRDNEGTVIDTTQGISPEHQSSSLFVITGETIQAIFQHLTFFRNKSSQASSSLTLFEVTNMEKLIYIFLNDILFTSEFPAHFLSHDFCPTCNDFFDSLRSRPLLISSCEAEFRLHSCEITHLSFEGTSFFERSDHTGLISLENVTIDDLQRTDNGDSGLAAAFVSDMGKATTSHISKGMNFINSSITNSGNRNSMKGGVISTTIDNNFGCYFIRTNFSNCFCSNNGYGGVIYIDMTLHGGSISKLASMTFNLIQSSSNSAKNGSLAFLFCQDYKTQLNDILFPLDAAKVKEEFSIAAMNEGETEIVDAIKLYAYTRFTNVYVSETSKDDQNCGELENPCFSLEKGASHLSLTDFGMLSIVDSALLSNDIRLTNAGLSQRVLSSMANISVNSTIQSSACNDAVFECSLMIQMDRIAFFFPLHFQTDHNVFIYMKEGNLSFDSCEFNSEKSSNGNAVIGPTLIKIGGGSFYAANIRINELDFEDGVIDVGVKTSVNISSARIFDVSLKSNSTGKEMIKIMDRGYSDERSISIDHLEVLDVSLNDGTILKIGRLTTNSNFSNDNSESRNLIYPLEKDDSSINLTSFTFNKIDAGPHSEGLIILSRLGVPVRITMISIKDCFVSFCLGSAVNVDNCSITFDQGEFSEIRHQSESQFNENILTNTEIIVSNRFSPLYFSETLNSDLYYDSSSRNSKMIFNGDPPTPCKWKTGALFAARSQLNLQNVSFHSCSVGGLYILDTNTNIDDCSFSLNSPKFEGFPSALHNIRCIDSSLSVKKLKSGDGVETGSSLWMQRDNCEVNGAAITDEFPLLFKPTLNSVELISSDANPVIIFNGEKLMPCNLTFEVNFTSKNTEYNQVLEFSKHINETYAEGIISRKTIDDMDKGTSLTVTLLYWKSEKLQERIQIFTIYTYPNKQSDPEKMPVWAIAVIACVTAVLIIVSAVIVVNYTKKIKRLKTQLTENEPLLYKSEYSMNSMYSSITVKSEFHIPFDSQEPCMED
ncbi:uncharacterized protein MONOS_6819 [Monocercomonoides exilis]|uniref:uncharacterized protein n=1 Tax=Monocercomonoides exilis TaxID=2049356 RepID=UPI00355A385E|nr:hypothetical protein MONOS_6819 [Monocercomonoides exilis]|eukprot:MONOS_6819.1-p1 / transcript=MONOS_6819.1 / gene=MONOS_6819 / organism=Monocercomonoides_exilis_PA203 / gene_product=unspecified product / transcript_product=unspecified product / location=Mono_scaffold00222:38349-42872(-) / protein_length=1406 / sequence_SO=supercontig / SO=protein_coding / is_pseudo=false